jgi:hypothetical protein
MPSLHRRSGARARALCVLATHHGSIGTPTSGHVLASAPVLRLGHISGSGGVCALIGVLGVGRFIIMHVLFIEQQPSA